MQGSVPRKKLQRRASIKRMDMRVALLLSVLTHVFSPVALLLVAIVVAVLLGLDISDWFRHVEPKQPDIEFVLTPRDIPEKPPLNPDTPYRAAQDMQAGGQHDPTRPVVIPEQAETSLASEPAPPVAPEPVKPQQQAVEKTLPTPPKPQVKPQEPKPQPRPVEAQKPVSVTKSIIASKTSTAPPVPVVAKTVPKPPQATSPMARSIPVPASAMMAASSASASSRNSIGSLVNPGPGNIDAPPGVDAKKDPDFGPYMKELQRRIKQSWKPPRGNQSKRVVLVFRVNRQGELEDVRINKSSGEVMTDQAAVVAIQNVFPFRPLPAEFAKESIDIEFTFDYNVFGDKRRAGQAPEAG